MESVGGEVERRGHSGGAGRCFCACPCSADFQSRTMCRHELLGGHGAADEWCQAADLSWCRVAIEHHGCARWVSANSEDIGDILDEHVQKIACDLVLGTSADSSTAVTCNSLVLSSFTPAVFFERVSGDFQVVSNPDVFQPGADRST